jgi:hypothetical protein
MSNHKAKQFRYYAYTLCIVKIPRGYKFQLIFIHSVLGSGQEIRSSWLQRTRTLPGTYQIGRLFAGCERLQDQAPLDIQPITISERRQAKDSKQVPWFGQVYLQVTINNNRDSEFQQLVSSTWYTYMIIAHKILNIFWLDWLFISRGKLLYMLCWIDVHFEVDNMEPLSINSSFILF